jgi:hypothetical protein
MRSARRNDGRPFPCDCSQSPIGHTGLILRELPLTMLSQTAAAEEQSAVRIVRKPFPAGDSTARNFARRAVLDVDVVYGK